MGNALTSKGSTAFHIACCQGKLEIVKLLVGEPKTQNRLNANKNQGTGFLKACYFGQYEIVSYLLEDADTKGIEIKSSNHKGGLISKISSLWLTSPPKKVIKHTPEHHIFRWIVLRGVIWHLFF